jgi:structural maintenance of chromosome 4
LGRATFIILEKIREEFGPKSQQPCQVPDNAKRLYDLIKVKEKDKELLPAFYFAVRDTLVADSLDMATKIAFSGRRWRVVTLNGELIDVSGTMSGGGAQKQSGGMRGQQNDVDPEVAQKRINKLQKDIDAGTAKLNDVRQQTSNLENDIERLTKELREMEVDLRKKEMDVGGYTKQHSELSKRIPELEKVCGLSKEEQASVAALGKQIAEFEKEVATIQKQSSKIQEEVKAVQKEIDDAGGIELKSQKAKVESFEMQLDSNTTQLTKLKVSITASEKAIKKADGARQAGVDEKQDTEVKLADLVESHKNLEIDAEAVHDRFQQAQAVRFETAMI